MNTELHLWRAVVTQAIADATSIATSNTALRDMREARAWFTNRSASFSETCALADLDPSAVREHALDLIAEFDSKQKTIPPRMKDHRGGGASNTFQNL